MEEKKKTQAQILTEMVLERKIKKTNGVIPINWWQLPEWKADYKRQIMSANSILKLFDFDVVLEALNSKSLNWIWTLSYKGLIQECSKISKNKAIQQKINDSKVHIKIDSTNVSHIPKQKQEKSMKDLLDE